MELSVSGRQRRAAQVTKAAPQAGKKTAGTGGGTASVKSKSDKASWSQGALAFLQELNRQDQERQRKRMEARQENNSDLEMLSKSLKTMDKCQKIASRIMKGDKVPPQDEMYLMEADPDGYKLAIACRTPKEKPKEWESVLDEEDQEGGSGGEAVGSVESGGEAVDSGGEAPEA